jgi:hypothetical protein
LSELFTVSGSNVAILVVINPKLLMDNPSLTAIIISKVMTIPREILIITSLSRADAWTDNASLSRVCIVTTSNNKTSVSGDFSTLGVGNVLKGSAADMIAFCEERDLSAVAYICRHDSQRDDSSINPGLWLTLKTFLRRSLSSDLPPVFPHKDSSLRSTMSGFFINSKDTSDMLLYTLLIFGVL